MSEDVLTKIKAWRLLALDRAFIALGSHPYRVEQFREFGKGSNFNCFSLYWHKKFDEMDIGSLGIDQPIDKDRFSPEQYSKLIEINSETAKAMQQAIYEPPAEIPEIIVHLWIMYHLYKNHPVSWPPTKQDMCLDFSFIKLITLAQRDLVILTAHAEREITRNVKSAQAKKFKKEENSKPIIETFYALIFPKEVFPKGASLHKVAGMIENILKNKVKPPPSIFTIKRVLKTDEEIWKQFKEIKVKGRNYFIKQM